MLAAKVIAESSLNIPYLRLILCLFILTIGSCKTVRSGARLASETGSSPQCFPEFYAKLVDRWNEVPNNVELVGFADRQTFSKAQKYLSERVENPPSLSEGRVILAEAFGSGWSEHKKIWLIAYAEHRLFFFEQETVANRTPRTLEINELTVHKIVLSANSERLSMITGDQGEEVLNVSLSDLSIVNIVGDPKSTFEYLQDFLEIRSKDIERTRSQSEFYRGFAHQLMEVTNIIKRKSRDHDRQMHTHVEKILGTGWYNAKDEEAQRRGDFDLPMLQNGTLIIGGPHGAKDPAGRDPFRPVLTNGEVTAFSNHRQRHFGNRFWHYATRSCRAGFDSQSSCELAIVHGYDERKTNVIFREQLPATRRNESISALALSTPRAGEYYLAKFYKNGTSSSDHGGRLEIKRVTKNGQVQPIRTFTFSGNVRLLRFLDHDLAEVKSDTPLQLMVATGDQRSLRYMTLNFEAVLKPILLGEHAQNHVPLNKIASNKPAILAYKSVDTPTRHAFWDALPEDDRNAVYGLAFDPQNVCGQLVSGGSDGKIKIWGGRRQLAVADAAFNSDPSPIMNIHVNPRGTRALIAKASGLMAVVDLFGSQEMNATVFNVMTPAEDSQWRDEGNSEESASRRPAQQVQDKRSLLQIKSGQLLQDESGIVVITGNGEVKFFDLNGLPSDRKMDEVSEARLAESASSKDAHNIVAMAPNADFLRLPNLHFFANDRGWVSNANISQRSGGEYHLVSVNERAQPFMPTAITPSPDGQWLIVAGNPEHGSSVGVLRRYDAKARASGSWYRYDHCPNAQALPRQATMTQAAFVPYLAHVGPVTAVLAGKVNNEDRIISTGLDGRLVVWSLLDPCINQEPGQERELKLQLSNFADQSISSLAANRDGRYIATGTFDGKVLVWWVEDSIVID
jgi:WD40 repeat protein